MSEQKYQIILVDDDVEMLHALEQSIGLDASIDIIAAVPDPRYARALIHKSRPSVALIDVEMPELNGIELARAVKAESPGVGVIMLTNFRHDDWLQDALEAGADGFVTKDTPRDEILMAIKKVAKGGQVMSTRPLKLLTESYQTQRRQDATFLTQLESLTPAERRVWTMLLEAKTNRLIARELGVEEPTVKTHVAKVMQKFDARSRTELLLMAARNGFIT